MGSSRLTSTICLESLVRSAANMDDVLHQGIHCACNIINFLENPIGQSIKMGILKTYIDDILYQTPIEIFVQKYIEN